MTADVEDSDLNWDMGDAWDETDVDILFHSYPESGPKLCVPKTNEALYLALEDPQHPAAAGILRLQSRGIAALRMEASRVQTATGCLYEYEESRGD